MSEPMLHALIDHIKDELRRLEMTSAISAQAVNPAARAGKETLFKKLYLFPSIARFFYERNRQTLCLSDDEIKCGLGAEGYRDGLPKFGYTPASKRDHLFTKSQVVSNTVPAGWRMDDPIKLNPFRPCPDFSIREPLPLSVLGEVKYFDRGSPDTAVPQLFDVARQAVFYLGAYFGQYRAALVVVGDASPEHAFLKGLKLLKPELLDRFGSSSGVYLRVVGLR